ncbi:MAG TPA: nucleotidyltransferase domain-containing protein [Longimicrobiales bacterium]|nr:nucleotidyltransferase domain-containing protein [Longimicrobiales bacterium]
MRTRGDALDVLGIAPAAARIIRYFLIRPDARPHSRDLQRSLGLGGASLQRELERMVELGALRKEREGRRTHYRAIEGAAIWTALRILEATSADPAPLLRNALVDVPGLHAAFIFGSAATGEQREDSDIDLLVVEEPTADRKTLLRHFAEVGLLLGREVNAVRYTPQALADRLGDPTHPAWGFVREVLSGPKQWIAGTSSAIAPLTAAAGISTRDLVGAAA